MPAAREKQRARKEMEAALEGKLTDRQQAAQDLKADTGIPEGGQPFSKELEAANTVQFKNFREAKAAHLANPTVATKRLLDTRRKELNTVLAPQVTKATKAAELDVEGKEATLAARDEIMDYLRASLGES